jgi:hypothetical protein
VLVHRTFDDSPRMAFARHEISRDKMSLGSQLVLSVEPRSLTNLLIYSHIKAETCPFETNAAAYLGMLSRMVVEKTY